MKNKSIITKLRRRMKVEGLSQADIAHDIGTNKYTVHRWLSGKAVPSDAYVRILKQYLNA